MSDPYEPAGRRPSAGEIAHYRAEVATFGRADDLLVRQVVGALLGAGVGSMLSVVLVPLTLLLFVNPVTALVLLLIAVVAGGIIGWRRTRRAESVLRSKLQWELQQADKDYERKLNDIRKGAIAMKASGVEDHRISDWAYHEIVREHRTFRGNIEPYLHLGTAVSSPAPRPLPSAPASVPPPPLATTPPVLPPTTTPSSSPTHISRSRAVNLPPELVQAKRSGVLAPFVGAGLSMGKDVTGGFPEWRQIPGLLISNVPETRWLDPGDKTAMHRSFYREVSGHPGKEEPRPMKLAAMLGKLDEVKTKLNRDYHGALRTIFGPKNASPGAAHRAVLALDPRVVLTTNYDRLIEKTNEAPPSREVYTWKDSKDALLRINSGDKVLLKVHGSVHQTETVILTGSEYADLRRNITYQKVIEHLLNTHTLLFLGYGMSDPDDLDIVIGNHAEALGHAASRHFALLRESSPPDQSEVDRRETLLDKYNIEVIPFQKYEEIVVFLESLAKA